MAAAVRRSAGILLYRQDADSLRVLLAHMGGPFFTNRDKGGWTVPKGEPEPDEELETTARREFAEELGLPVPPGPLVPLGEITQKGGKVVTAWALEGDLDVDAVVPGPSRWSGPGAAAGSGPSPRSTGRPGGRRANAPSASSPPSSSSSTASWRITPATPDPAAASVVRGAGHGSPKSATWAAGVPGSPVHSQTSW